MTKVQLYDTTLRDGMQGQGMSLSAAEKVRVVQALDALGVHLIEAGFPVTSPGDFEAVREIARDVSGPVVCGAHDVPRSHPPDAVAGSVRLPGQLGGG